MDAIDELMKKLHHPYAPPGSAVISFSGGRTSGYMLHEILKHHNFVLPEDYVVTFANTGKEHEATLEFVRDCELNWGCKIVWLEFQPTAPLFKIVNFETASRAGEPFADLIAKKKIPPNMFMRFCTSEMKVIAIKRYLKSLGWKRWKQFVGLRYDEGHRVMKVIDREANAKRPERWETLMPLSKMKITKPMIMEFWQGNSFDLKVGANKGNCDLCFAKGKQMIKSLIAADPNSADWWIEQEQKTGGTFIKGISYLEMKQQALQQGASVVEETEFDAECGTSCIGDDE
jgi:3'-phosphoadenosine 5'-phosphosulfate sulfotransferase (PAPS reductase)/FAD synthetase